MRHNQQRDAHAQIQIADAEQKAQEYQADADRTRGILKRVGLVSDALSKSGVQSLQTLSAACIALDAKNTTPSTLLIASGHRKRDLLNTASLLTHEERDVDKLVRQTKSAISRKVGLDKLFSDLDESEQQKLPILKQKRQQAEFHNKKVHEYQKQVKKLEAELKNSFSGQQPVKHEELQQQSEYLGELSAELAPLQALLDSYHSLPADLTMTKVKVEEAKLKLQKMEQQLDQGIDLLDL